MNITDEQYVNRYLEHYDSRKNHWCIVTYVGSTPWYYTGYFGKIHNQVSMKPAISIDFEKALKMHTKMAAEQVLQGLIECSGVKKDEYKVEDHAWFASDLEIKARNRKGSEL
jgi:hypothetical protein